MDVVILQKNGRMKIEESGKERVKWLAM